jgi:hypothetical protein
LVRCGVGLRRMALVVRLMRLLLGVRRGVRELKRVQIWRASLTGKE